MPSGAIDDDHHRALTGRLARVERDLGQVANDGLRPAAFVVGVLFVVFGAYNWVALPPDARTPLVLYDAALIAFSFALYGVCRRFELSSNGVHVAAAALSLGVLGNIVFTTLLTPNPLFSFYIAVLVIASAGSVLSIGWALAI
ncbi:MAG TPA: hypothetical protein VFT22_29210, partial [Kofleriaceae bacterium]|nr:hypothetical protein [Kofleriaceae bacterium]